MPSSHELKIRKGVWIKAEWLRAAGLGSHVQVIVENGEIRIVSAQAKMDSSITAEQGWAVFRSFGKNATSGKLENAGKEHDRYLYGKAK